MVYKFAGLEALAMYFDERAKAAEELAMTDRGRYKAYAVAFKDAARVVRNCVITTEATITLLGDDSRTSGMTVSHDIAKAVEFAGGDKYAGEPFDAREDSERRDGE